MKTEFTLKTGEMFIMEFYSDGCVNFACIGTNPYEMYERIIECFNLTYNTGYNASTIRQAEMFDDFYIPLCKIKSVDGYVYSNNADIDSLNDTETVIMDFKDIYYDTEWRSQYEN